MRTGRYWDVALVGMHVGRNSHIQLSISRRRATGREALNASSYQRNNIVNANIQEAMDANIQAIDRHPISPVGSGSEGMNKHPNSHKMGRMYFILCFIAATLATVYTAVFLFIENFVFRTIDFPDNTRQTNSSITDFQGNHWKVSGTAPTSLLNYEDYQLFYGIFIFVNIEIAGIGLEFFVWWNMLQKWDSKREAMWKFAQFIFPILQATAMGLAFERSFLAMPVYVLGMWKLGFPETIMYMYLGFYGRKDQCLRRASDLINGVGTALHHSAAAFLIGCLLSGLLSPSRYLVTPCCILIIQHWFVLLAYVNEKMYIGTILMIEVWLEWTVFSDFQELRASHRSAALGASVFLLAHWLYLTAGCMELFMDKNSAENVHQRGTDSFRRQKTCVHKLHMSESCKDTEARCKSAVPHTRRFAAFKDLEALEEVAA